jgi:hypothetical protein
LKAGIGFTTGILGIPFSQILNLLSQKPILHYPKILRKNTTRDPSENDLEKRAKNYEKSIYWKTNERDE